MNLLMLLSPLLVLLIPMAVIAAFRFRIVRRVFFFVVNLFPAAILALLGIVAIPLWRLMNFLSGILLRLLPLDRGFEGFLTRLSQWRLRSVEHLDALLLRGERRAVAEVLWPQETFPDLYREVPDDVIRPPFDDGRLVGGMRLAWLADRYMTGAALRSAVRIGVTTALVAFVGILLAYLISTVGLVTGSLSTAGGAGAVVAGHWLTPEAQDSVPRWWAFTASVSATWPVILKTLGSVLTFLPGSLMISLGLGLLIVLLMLHTWQKEKEAPYSWESKDASVRWPYRAETRKLVRATYRRQVLEATGRLGEQPLFQVGRATGVLRARGDLAAPVPAQPLRLDQEALFQHMLVFGGTGEGKTSALLKPMLRQLLRNPGFGLYVCDAKGVLWSDVVALAQVERPGGEVIVIGTGQGQFGVDLLAGLSATQVAATLRSVLTQMSGGDVADSFWPDMAATVLRNVLSIARAYALTEQGRDSLGRTGASPYSLWWAYQAVLRPELLAEANDHLRQWISDANARLRENPRAPELADLRRSYRQITTREVYDSIAYLESTWRDMAVETRSGIVANITQLLDGFAGAQVLRDRFASGNPENTIRIGEALHGKIVLNALSMVEDGLPARIVSILLKTNLYRAARSREAAYRKGENPENPQSRPCIVVVDEVQELVTADVTSGLSDATFWNVARSTGVAGIFATQTVAALHQAIGEDAANNFMQQARSKVFFRTEDRETVEYACWCAGKFERNRVFDDGHRESLDFRGLIDGWDPLVPVDETEEVSGGAGIFFRSALGLLNPERLAVGTTTVRRAYEEDTRFVTSRWLGQDVSYVAEIQSRQAAAWRAEDLERDYRKTGNELAEALTPSDLIHMGRWHAFAQVQRAGDVRQDIIAVEHDFD